MKFAIGLLVFANSIALAQNAPARPPITGISHIAVYTTNPAAADHYYADIVGCEKRSDPENPQGTRYYVNTTQFVEVLPLPDKSSPNRLDHLAYKTANAEKLRLYLKAKDVDVPASVEKAGDGSRWFNVKDPEGNTVQFVQPPAHPQAVHDDKLVGHHIIHVGMLVRSREKEDTFYRAILDFKPYWFGGMRPDKIDWVSQQTPESHDWLEYMLTSGPSGGGIQDVSQKQLGVLNHFSIGVVNMRKTWDTLKAANRLSGPNDHTQIGKDGKWQLNLFDPDGTRLEYMEFSNVQKPCCSDFTAPNPSPTER
ncbi:MAG TPA: VOC family protein [Alloacidobacterium sp.]|nr:VOC family protein [Alloacidobacterium sp.]